jgi:hypothetical protein
MRPLSAHDVLRVWERGRGQQNLERAIAILADTSPDLTREQIYRLPVGERDLRLLELREQTFGPHLSGLAQCPSCGAELEFSLNAQELRLPSAAPPETIDLHAGGRELTLRRPDTEDLAIAAECSDEDETAHVLARRCVISGAGDGPLTNELIEAIGERLSEADPQSEMMLHFVCPQCIGEWRALFDIVSFFWAEIASTAKRLLLEVHTLARSYGWSERDILAMTAVRRQAYLEMLGA